MMFRSSRIAFLLASFFMALTCITPASAGPNVLTRSYDNARTGANLNETRLSPSTVTAGTFGKLWAYMVSGSVLAQPLYVQSLGIPGKGLHNVLYVVTLNDIVYAFDADNRPNGLPLWSVDLGAQVPNSRVLSIGDIPNAGGNVIGNVGIESTPVIDLATHTMYLVDRTLESNLPDCTLCLPAQRLHALDITTGAEKFGGPMYLDGQVIGSANGVAMAFLFDPLIHNQRPSLALANGQIYIAWASHGDNNPYRGWIMSYNATTLLQTGIFSTTPDSRQGGIWMAGRAPAVDASGNVYYMAGNGPQGGGGYDGVRNFGESMLKFPAAGPLFPSDWFVPFDWLSLDGGDQDYGSSGPLLIPGTDLIVGAGKSSVFYVMHTGGFGAGGVHRQAGNGQIVQSLANNGGEVESGPVYWDRRSGLLPQMYDWSNGRDRLKGYYFDNATLMFQTSPVANSSFATNGGNIGAALALSANGTTPGSGIVWASMLTADDSDNFGHTGVLLAFNADNLLQELWSSGTLATDAVGNWAKFTPPTVANGRVYMASVPADGVGTTNVTVYGLVNGIYPSPAGIIVPIITDLLLN
jgi:hypothetical protein